MRLVTRCLFLGLLIARVVQPVAADDGPVVGDHLLVTTADAPLRSRNDTTGHVPASADLAIKHIDGDWFWVVYEHGRQAERGWIHRADVVERSGALDQLNERLRNNPTAAIYAVRGKLRFDHGRFDIALGDCNQALCLDCSSRLAYDTRASIWMKSGDFDRAVADWNEALRLDPQDIDALNGRASAWMGKAEIDIAAAEKLKPRSPIVRASAAEISPLSFTTDNSISKGSLVATPKLTGSLTLRSVAFCKKIVNYGIWERFEKDVFAPRQPVLLYAEIDDFTSKLASDGVWLTRLQSHIDIRDARGELVHEMPFAPNDDECKSVRRDYYNSYEFNIPATCTPGSYTLILQVEDMLNGNTGTQSVPFIVE